MYVHEIPQAKLFFQYTYEKLNVSLMPICLHIWKKIQFEKRLKGIKSVKRNYRL